MVKSWITFVATALLVAGVGFWLLERNAASQVNQDPETRIRQKIERLQALVQQRQQEGADLQPVAELMQGFEPLLQEQKLAEAEALLDRALELVNKSGALKQTGTPPSLQQKMQRLRALVDKRRQEGGDLQPIGQLMQGFQPLMQQQKFSEAEALVDRALALLGESAATVPQEQTGTPPSLQQKMQRLRALAQKRMQEGGDLQPVGEVMGGLQPLIKQQRFNEAEAMVDRALELLGEPAPVDSRFLIAYGARDADGRQQIFVVRADGTEKRRLTQDGNRNFFPAWSPDGKRLAFGSDRSGTPQIWVADADGANARQLTSQGENVIPTWSPDGKRLAFESTRTGHSQIWLMDADGGNQKQLTTTTVSLGDHAPAWSPDGRRIAFVSTRSGNFAIWLIDPDGSSLTQLTTPRGARYRDSNFPAWSPDGTKIAFWSGVGFKDGNIWVVDADGRDPRLLTEQPPGVNCDEPVWSSDGKKILFASNRPGSQGIGIWIMEADGSNQKIFITDTHVKSRPAWQPAGAKRQAAN